MTTEGQIGAQPPAHAPTTPSQPLQADAGSIVVFDRTTNQPTGEVITPAARHAQNARTLEPLTYKDSHGDARAARAEADAILKAAGGTGLPPLAADAAPPDHAPLPSVSVPVARTSTRDEAAPTTETDAGTTAARDHAGATAPPSLDPIVLAQFPAASNTDSPSRGIPRSSLDPGKQVTGGFGLPTGGPAQYFALDGRELAELIRGLLDRLNARLENDLRFTEALTYPRVTARVVVEIECFAKRDNDYQIAEVLVPVARMTKDAARAHADEVCFVLVADHQEVDATGASVTPPDQVREDLGLDRPFKQEVLSGGSTFMVDRLR